MEVRTMIRRKKKNKETKVLIEENKLKLLVFKNVQGLSFFFFLIINVCISIANKILKIIL